MLLRRFVTPSVTDIPSPASGEFGGLPTRGDSGLRSSSFLSAEYWLLDEGVLRISLIPNWVTALVIAAFFGVFEVGMPLLGYGEPNPISVMGFVGIGFYLVLGYSWSVNKRLVLGSLPYEEVVKTQRSATLHPWSEVSEAELDGDRLGLMMKGRWFKSKLESDPVQTTDLLRAKLGKKAHVYNMRR